MIQASKRGLELAICSHPHRIVNDPPIVAAHIRPATTGTFAGVWDHIPIAISHQNDAEVQMIDSTIVRAHQHASCTEISASEEFGHSP